MDRKKNGKMQEKGSKSERKELKGKRDERKKTEEKGNGKKRKEIEKKLQERILGSIITQIINCQSNKRRKINLTSIHATIH